MSSTLRIENEVLLGPMMPKKTLGGRKHECELGILLGILKIFQQLPPGVGSAFSCLDMKSGSLVYSCSPEFAAPG